MPVPENMQAVSGPAGPEAAPRWETLPGMAQRRVYAAAALQAGGRLLYVLGGCGETGAALDSGEVLDLESRTWTALPPLPSGPRAGASAVALAGGRVMVLGGMDHRQTALATVEVYHPDEGRWERRAPLGQPSMGVTALEKGTCSDPLESSLALACWSRAGTDAEAALVPSLHVRLMIAEV
ncbi:unnamed protein product [Arctogadus glacialis]